MAVITMLTSPGNSCDVTLRTRTRTNSEVARSSRHRELVGTDHAVHESDGVLIRHLLRPSATVEHRRHIRLIGRAEDSWKTKTMLKTSEKTKRNMITTMTKNTTAICFVSTAEFNSHHPIRTVLTGSTIASDVVRLAAVQLDGDVVARWT